MAKLGAVIDALEDGQRTDRHRRPVLDQHRGVPRHRSLHRHVHDEREPLRLGLRGRRPRHALHARPRARQPDALRPARLEQQLRRRPRQGRLLPLLQPSQTLLQPRREDGLSAHHRRHGRQGEHPRHARRPRQGRPHELRPLLHRRLRRHRSRATSARAHSPTTRSTPSAAPASSRSPTCRNSSATSATTASSTTSPPASPPPPPPSTKPPPSTSTGPPTGTSNGGRIASAVIFRHRQCPRTGTIPARPDSRLGQFPATSFLSPASDCRREL